MYDYNIFFLSIPLEYDNIIYTDGMFIDIRNITHYNMEGA